MMATVSDDYCSIILKPLAASEHSDVNELRSQLEKGSERGKIEAMKTLLHLTANGDHVTALSLLMHVIRFVLPGQKNKLLKKLVLLFFEMVPTRDPEGRLRQEMILVWYNISESK